MTPQSALLILNLKIRKQTKCKYEPDENKLNIYPYYDAQAVTA